MSWVFLISVAIVLICAYICQHSSDEIAELAASILLVSLFLSLLCAPWQIQCLLLILVLVSNPRYLLRSEPIAKPQEDKKTQLVYRGIQYEPTTPPVKASHEEIVGKYRGQIWRVRT